MIARAAPALLLLLLTGCGHRPAPVAENLDALDRELADANAMERDPAVAAALHDQIMVDPALAQSSNANAVRPPSRPDSGAVPPDTVAARPDPVDPATLRKAPAAAPGCPQCRAASHALTLGALAARQSDPASRACAGQVRYSADYANRLPEALPLYPDARVAEAAGNDRPGCALRVVNFATGAMPGKVIDWYYTHASAAGYSAEHRAGGGEDVLGGTRGAAAYVVYATPRAGGGSDVDLVTNAGR